MILNNTDIFNKLIKLIYPYSNFNYIQNTDICSFCKNYDKLFIKSSCPQQKEKEKICIECASNIKSLYRSEIPLYNKNYKFEFHSLNDCNNDKYSLYNCKKKSIFDNIFNNYNDHILLSISILNYDFNEYIKFIRLIYYYNDFFKYNYIFYLNLERYHNNLIKESKYFTFLLNKYGAYDIKNEFYKLIIGYVYTLKNYLDVSYSDTYLLYSIV